MTQRASPDSVLGSFDGTTLGAAPRFRLGRAAGEYYVDIEGPGTDAQRRAVPVVTGSHHMQIYWYETGSDRSLTQLPFVYLTSDQRWVPRSAIFIEPPNTPHPAGNGRWNTGCIACHTTLGQPRAAASGAFDTHVAEFGIACEACHGPAEEHVTRYKSPLARYLRHVTGSGADAIVQPKKLTHDRAALVCGQCHSTWLWNGPAEARDWNLNGPQYRPGDADLGAAWLVQPSRAALDPQIAGYLQFDPRTVRSQFWSDGMVRVSGREFNGIVDSPCYVRGELSCSSCHAMHQPPDDPRPPGRWKVGQLAREMDGDAACLQCHDRYARAPQAHTHHPPGSAGSRCYNCHMPYTSYGLLKALRSHRIDSPSVEATLQAGRPNACNLCHLDKTLQWTAEQLEASYGIKAREVSGDFASQPAALVLALRGDAGQRALIAWALGWAAARTDQRAAFTPALLGILLDDPYTAVRYVALRSLQRLNVPTEALSYDFLVEPSTREPSFDSVVRRMAPELSAEARAAVRAGFEPLLHARDDRPIHLLE